MPVARPTEISPPPTDPASQAVEDFYPSVRAAREEEEARMHELSGTTNAASVAPVDADGTEEKQEDPAEEKADGPDEEPADATEGMTAEEKVQHERQLEQEMVDRKLRFFSKAKTTLWRVRVHIIHSAEYMKMARTLVNVRASSGSDTEYSEDGEDDEVVEATPAEARATRAKLLAFYLSAAPENVPRLDEILGAYKGREEALWHKLYEKYPHMVGRDLLPLPGQQADVEGDGDDSDVSASGDEVRDPSAGAKAAASASTAETTGAAADSDSGDSSMDSSDDASRPEAKAPVSATAAAGALTAKTTGVATDSDSDGSSMDSSDDASRPEAKVVTSAVTAKTTGTAADSDSDCSHSDDADTVVAEFMSKEEADLQAIDDLLNSIESFSDSDSTDSTDGEIYPTINPRHVAFIALQKNRRALAKAAHMAILAAEAAKAARRLAKEEAAKAAAAREAAEAAEAKAAKASEGKKGKKGKKGKNKKKKKKKGR